MFWGSCDELGQAPPLLPFPDALAVRTRPVNPRQNIIAGLLREILPGRAADVPAVLAGQLLALVADERELSRPSWSLTICSGPMRPPPPCGGGWPRRCR